MPMGALGVHFNLIIDILCVVEAIFLLVVHNHLIFRILKQVRLFLINQWLYHNQAFQWYELQNEVKRILEMNR